MSRTYVSRVPDCHPERRHIARGMCNGCYKKWAKHNPSETQPVRAYASRTPECHPDRKHFGRGMCKSCYSVDQYGTKRKENRLIQLYGVDFQEKQRMSDAQGGGCAICGRVPDPGTKVHNTLHIDHDHETGRVRGLLCRNCNVAIGLIGDDPQILSLAAQYVAAGKVLTI